jgi:predicted esterase
MAAAIMVLHPELLSGAILLSPMRPIDPVNPPDLYGKQIFIGAGESDTIAPPDGVIQLADQLKGFGADVESHFYPIGHRISQDELSDAKNWIDHRISD